MALNIAIWADGRAEVGAGHLVRSRVVGEALKARGHRVSWFSNSNDGALFWAWEGLSSQISQANSLREFDVCIVDGYDEKIDLHSDGGVLCRIHDAAMMPLPQADVWIDHGPSAHPQQHPEAIALTGLGYAMVRPEFYARPWQADLVGQGILVVPGGGDAGGLLPFLAPILSTSAWSPYAIKVVGISQELLPHNWQSLGTLSPSQMADELANCSLAITTASGSALEALAVGCPLLAVEVVENQREMARGLAEKGCHIVSKDQLSSADIQKALGASPIPSSQDLLSSGAAYLALRVELICQTQKYSLLRPVKWADAKTLFDWQQDPGIRAASLVGAEVTWEGHCQWLGKRLRDPRCFLFMAESDGKLLGTIRLESSAEHGELVISIAVAPEARGQGWGKRLLAETKKVASTLALSERIRALVRCDNPASRRCFEQSGYRLANEELVHGHPTAVYILELNSHV